MAEALEADLEEPEGSGLGGGARGGGGDAEVPGDRECGSSAVEADMMRLRVWALLDDLGDGLCTPAPDPL